MNKTKTIYLDTPIWNIEQPKRYAQMFEHYLLSPAVVKDAVDWADYLKGNKN